MCEELICPNVCIVGDFNACSGNAFGKLLDTFSNENGYVMSERKLMAGDIFTLVTAIGLSVG